MRNHEWRESGNLQTVVGGGERECGEGRWRGGGKRGGRKKAQRRKDKRNQVTACIDCRGRGGRGSEGGSGGRERGGGRGDGGGKEGEMAGEEKSREVYTREIKTQY